jgi:hypothetical protein
VWLSNCLIAGTATAVVPALLRTSTNLKNFTTWLRTGPHPHWIRTLNLETGVRSWRTCLKTIKFFFLQIF